MFEIMFFSFSYSNSFFPPFPEPPCPETSLGITFNLFLNFLLLSNPPLKHLKSYIHTVAILHHTKKIPLVLCIQQQLCNARAGWRRGMEAKRIHWPHPLREKCAFKEKKHTRKLLFKKKRGRERESGKEIIGLQYFSISLHFSKYLPLL